MTFLKGKLTKRQFELKAKNKVAEELSQTAKVKKLFAQLEVIKDELARLNSKRRAIEYELEKLMQSKEERIRKLVSKDLKTANLCPACTREHKTSPPDSCWIMAHNADLVFRAAFDDYLKRNNFGKL